MITKALGIGLYHLKELKGDKVCIGLLTVDWWLNKVIYLKVKRVNGFHLKRCPHELINMDEPLGHPVPETRDLPL